MPFSPLTIAFHGQNAANFRPSFEALIDPRHTLLDLSDGLDRPGEAERWASADVVVGIRLDARMPTLGRLRLFHAPAAGTDAIDTRLLPPGCALCNCFGHENAIAEYVMAALLLRHVPLIEADADLRQQRWTWGAGRPGARRTELGSQTLGVLGFGHIGQTLAARARAFGMQVHAANRSPIDPSRVDRAYSLAQLGEFMASADAVVVTLPLTPQTQSLVNAQALAAMRPDAVLVNVGRGPVVDETALYHALRERRIGGAVIDTWYRYPAPGQTQCAPSQHDFAALENVRMTPHMSGWTEGTVRRRQQTLAENIERLAHGQPLLNTLHTA